MKALAVFAILLSLIFSTKAQLVTNLPAQLKFKIVAYEGKIGSGTCSTCMNPTPDAVCPGNSGSNKVTSPGHESELKWVFVGRNKNKDVYQITFTSQVKKESADLTTSSREIQFDGKKMIVFEDELHAVVVESPSEKDLKTAQKH